MAHKDGVVVWRENEIFDGTPTSGFTVRMDGAGKAGPSPMELVLLGLAGCTGADVIDILRKKRQEVTSLEVRVHGERAAEHPRKYTHVEVNFVVTGRGVDPQAVRRSIELSETKYCSVSATLRDSAQITTRFEVHEAQAVAS